MTLSLSLSFPFEDSHSIHVVVGISQEVVLHDGIPKHSIVIEIIVSADINPLIR